MLKAATMATATISMDAGILQNVIRIFFIIIECVFYKINNFVFIFARLTVNLYFEVMRKFFLCCLTMAVMSLPLLADGPEIRITPRLEGNVSSAEGLSPDWNLGASSLYAFVDGDFSSHFSYTASLHLLSTQLRDLYNQKYPLVNCSWLDWAYVSYDGGFIGVDVGKICHNFGFFESDLDDVDCYSPMVSDTWTENCSYQYGATLRLNPWETQTFELQFTTSPFMKSIAENVWAYSLCWRGEMGVLSTKWSFSRQYAEEESEEGLLERNAYNYIGIDNKLTFDNFMYTLGFSNCGAAQIGDISCSEFVGRAKFIGSEKVNVEAMLSWKRLKDLCYGLSVEYFPLKDDSLRLFAAASNRHLHTDELPSAISNFMACLGVRYDLVLSFRKH